MMNLGLRDFNQKLCCPRISQGGIHMEKKEQTVVVELTEAEIEAVAGGQVRQGSTGVEG